MKSLVPWFCLVAVASGQALYATDGIEAYRLGNYKLAAENLNAQGSNDPVVTYYLGLMRLYGYGQLKNNVIALRDFTQAAEKGSLQAQLLLAHYYLVKEQNPDKAFLWFKKAADVDNTPAQMYVAAAYLFGYGVKKNPDIARRYYIEAAKKGNTIAQYTLALQFLESRDNRNKKMGIIWLTKAADKGYAKAQFKLGEAFVNGIAVAPDLVKGKALLMRAANHNILPAMIALGQVAKKEKDYQAAENWFMKAANENNTEAQLALAQLLLDASTPIYNSTTGFSWLQKAAKNGSYDAQIALAKMYKEGTGVPADPKLADQWSGEAKKNAPDKEKPMDAKIALSRWLSDDQNETLSKGSYQLGGIFNAWQNPDALKENNYNQPPQMNSVTRQTLYKPQFALVNPKDIPISEYFDVIAPLLNAQETTWIFPRYPLDKEITALLADESLVLKLDSEHSMVDLNASYPQVNDVQAFDYFEEKTKGWEHQANFQAVLSQLYGRAILGESSAQFELGQLYQYGIGVAKNPAQAITYFELAAIQQDVRAEYNLGILYLEGQTNPVDYHKGIEWLTDAAFKGNAYAQYALANIYEKGLNDPTGAVVVPPNHQQAIAMYYLASANNFGEAQYRLADYLVKEKKLDLSVTAKQNRNQLIKRLYQNAVKEGVAEAILPLAFYNAMDGSPEKQKEAFNVALKEANAGNSEAALLLGIMYERGISVASDEVESLSWYQKAAENPVSNFILGTYYVSGKSLSKDASKGKELLQQSANAGFSYANLNLAILKQQSGEDFLNELDKARQRGNSQAGLLLADYYLQQASSPEKMQQAGDIYRFFAGKGDKDAQVKLGFLYDRGLGGESNPLLAAQWYKASAEQGQPMAQYLLGQLHQLGRIEKDPNYIEAKKWFEKAQVSNPQAAVALGFIYETVDNDYNKAEKNYNKAALSGDAVAQYNLGLLYENGKGMPVDNLKAKTNYIQAAQQGHAGAMTQLGDLYFKGLGGKQGEQEAIAWYKRAAELKESNALYQLGLLSETGVGTELNLTEAIKHYQEAANLGNEKAKLALARMYQYGLGVDKDPQHAADIYKELAQINPYAQYQLALIYMEGSLGEPKLQEAKMLLQKASENGNVQARGILQRLNAEQEPKVSFLNPIIVNNTPIQAGQSADLMYLDALNEWNCGDEILSRRILDKIRIQFPQYAPAKRAYEQLNSTVKPGNKVG